MIKRLKTVVESWWDRLTDEHDLRMQEFSEFCRSIIGSESDVARIKRDQIDSDAGEYDPTEDLERFLAKDWDYDGENCPQGDYIWPNVGL